MNVPSPFKTFVKNLSLKSNANTFLKNGFVKHDRRFVPFLFDLKLYHQGAINYKNTTFRWPDTTLGYIGFYDTRFPLPGYIGLVDIYFFEVINKNKRKTLIKQICYETKNKITDQLPDNDETFPISHVQTSENVQMSNSLKDKQVLSPSTISRSINIKKTKDIKSKKSNNLSKYNLDPAEVIPVLQHILRYILPAERHIQTLFHAKAMIDYNHRQGLYEKIASCENNFVQCYVYDCPTLVKRDFPSIFPAIVLNSQAYLTAIGIVFNINSTQKLSQEELNTSLKESFDLYMNHVCSQFHLAGYWADFIQSNDLSNFGIDPTLIPASDILTSDMYKKHNLIITDDSTCKLIEHRPNADDNGTRFHGTIFTTAPYFSSVIKKILKRGVKGTT